MSYASFVGALAAAPIAGVGRAYTAPPTQIATADLPASFPLLPQGGASVAALSGEGGLRSMTCSLVIVIEPIRQGGAAANYAATLSVIDAAESAMRALAAGNHAIDRWTIDANEIQLGDALYWGVIVAVNGSEGAND